MAKFVEKSNQKYLVERLSALRCDTLKYFTEPVSDDRIPLSWESEPNLTAAISTLSDSAQSVSECSTKLVLSLKQSDLSDAGAQSICNEFGHLNEVLVTALMILSRNGVGFPLWHEAAGTVHRLVSAGVGLAEMLSSQNISEKETATLTGMVWETAKKVQQLPKSNRVAFRRSVMSKSSIIRETISEFTTMVEAGPSTPSTSSTGSPHHATPSDKNEFFDDLMDSFGDEDDQYSKTEFPVASACLTCLGYVRPTLKTMLDAFDLEATAIKNKSQHNQEKTLIRIHELWKLCNEITDVTTEVGSSLYPPLDKAQIKISLIPLEKVTHDIGILMVSIADNSPSPQTNNKDEQMSATPSTSSNGGSGGGVSNKPEKQIADALTPLRKVSPLWTNAIKKLNSVIETCELE